MFSYYGSKSKVVQYYPPPKHGTIIEPFGGSGRYALRYFENEVILNDKYEVVYRIWKFLQQCSPGDILNLPNLKQGDKIDRNSFDCIEMAWLMGFMIARGKIRPDLTVSPWGETELQRSKKRIAESLYKIKHWQFTNTDYTDLPNRVATWFIDSPYRTGGHKYVCSGRHIDFKELAFYCQERWGQTIVCENYGADWLPFASLKHMNTLTRMTHEGVWLNELLPNTRAQLRMAI